MIRRAAPFNSDAAVWCTTGSSATNGLIRTTSTATINVAMSQRAERLIESAGVPEAALACGFLDLVQFDVQIGRGRERNRDDYPRRLKSL